MDQTINLLLVEDSEDDADLLVLALRRAGITANCTRVESAEDFRAQIGQIAWDVVVSDVNLPGFGAVEALKIISELNCSIPFIVVSGHLNTEEAVELMRAGAEDFVKKDDLARLAPAIERALRDTELVRSRLHAMEQIRLLSQAVEQSPNGIVILNRQGLIEYVNTAFSAMCGFADRDVVGESFYHLLTQNSPSQRTQQMRRAFEIGGSWRGEVHTRRQDGSTIWLYLTLSPMRQHENDAEQFLIMLEDITMRKEYEQKLMRQASYDELTKLPNRLLAFDRISVALADSRRNHTRAALFFVDLDNFKNVNDTLGHFAGDALLIEAASRLQQCLRESTTLARFGGDEFLIVMPELESPQNAHIVAQRVLKALQAPFNIQGRELFVTASIGITLYPDDGENTQVLLQNADAAMYRSKDMGRNSYSFFTPEMNQQVSQRLGIETELRRAIANHEFHLVYQPVVTREDNRVVAVEALIRWQNKALGFVAPDKFIPIAEETGLIVPIGEWVLREAMRQVAHWNSRWAAGLRLAVNVSARQFQGEGMLPLLQKILQQTGLAATQLELEITERLVLSESGTSKEQLRDIHKLGIRLSVDDFGTGYSALSYLKRFPFEVLKIDRSFVRDITTDKDDASLAKAIIAMAHELGMRVIAEGVETDEQKGFLEQHNCDMMQGYLFGKPLKPEDFETQFLGASPSVGAARVGG
jgi:diguanylate cyclase (GGDEF)-like protein/PAS domain S-box-containing protein